MGFKGVFIARTCYPDERNNLERYIKLNEKNLLLQIDTDKLFNNISDITNANCEFWKLHLVKVLEESRSTAAPLNPSVMKEGFKKVGF